MYEHFKNELIFKLDSMGMGAANINSVIVALEQVSYNYTIEHKETQLAEYDDSIPDLVKQYIVCKKMEGVSDSVLYNYCNTLRIFFKWVNKEPEQVIANDIRLFLYQYQMYKGVSDRTLDNYRGFIGRFFKWAYDESYVRANLHSQVKPIRYEKKQKQALTQTELEYIRMACKTVREKAIVEFLYSTGCRVSELAIVKISDIDWHERSVKLFGKFKKHRTSFFNARTEILLKQYLNSRNDDCEYLFVSERAPIRPIKKDAFQKIIRVLMTRVDKVQKHVTPHVFRHTTATLGVRNGMSVENVRKLLGHERLDTTMIYVETSLDDVQTEHFKCIV